MFGVFTGEMTCGIKNAVDDGLNLSQELCQVPSMMFTVDCTKRRLMQMKSYLAKRE